MIGPITRWRNRRAVRALLADDDFLAELAEAREAFDADLAELEAAGADESFGELFAGPAPVDFPDHDHDVPALTDEEWAFVLAVAEGEGD